MKSNDLCIVDGCNSNVLAKNYCSKHYSQIRRNGEIKDNKPKKNKCKVHSCLSIGNGGHGFCHMHYKRIVNHGTIEIYSPYEKNEYSENQDGTITVILKNKIGEMLCSAIIDPEDYKIISRHKWHFDGNYAKTVIAFTRKKIRMHSLILPEASQVDHINKNKLDNRRENLRASSQKDNSRNTTISKNNTSGYIGVYNSKKRSMWYSIIVVNYKRIYLGSYKLIKDAIRARLIAEKKYFGEFAPQQHLYEEYGI